MRNVTRPSAIRHALREHAIGLIAIAILAGGVYFNALHSPFVWDDDWLIRDNVGIRDLLNIPEFFAPRYYQRFHAEFYREFGGRAYRPIPEVSFALDYAVWGLDTLGFHLTNVLVHMGNCALAYVLACRIFGHRRVALFSTLLFAVHPVHTEAVVWAKVRSQLMAVTFVLISLLAYARYSERPTARWAPLLYVSSVLCFGLAIFSKATAITLPAILALHVWCFVPRRQWRRLLLGLLPFAGAALVYFSLDPLVPGMPRTPLAPGMYLGVVVAALGEYIRLFVAPVGLCLDRAWNVREGAMLWRLIPTVPIVLAFFVGAALARRRSRPVFFALGWFLIALAPALRVAFMGRPVAESRMYGPSIGLCMVFGFLLHRLAERPLRGLRAGAPQRLAAAVCVLAVGVSSGLTIARNADWGDIVRLWLDTVQKNPGSWHAQTRIARMYKYTHRYEEAIEHYKAALKLLPHDMEDLWDLATLHEHIGKDDEAISLYRKILVTDNSHVMARVRLGVLFAKRGDARQAELYLTMAASMGPLSAEAHRNLGAFYANTGQYDKAIAAFQRAAGLQPDDAGIHAALAAAYRAAGRFDRAAAQYERSVAIDPANAQAWCELGSCHEQLGNRAGAIRAYGKCVALGGPIAELAGARLAQMDAQPSP
jgi:Flp pilus assembly protein TadD